MEHSSYFVGPDHRIFSTAAYQKDIHLLDVLDTAIRPSAFLLLSDGEYFVIGRNRLDLAAWLWTHDDIPEESLDLVCELLRIHFAGNPIHVTAKEQVAGAISARLERLGYRLSKGMGLITYTLRELKMPEDRGPIRLARMEELPLLSQMYADFQMACHGYLQNEACEESVRAAIEAGSLWLLERDGRVVSIMSAAVPSGGTYSRVRLVYTIPEAQGRGYAKWLAAKVCEEQLRRSPFVLLYADADNPRSNAAYQRIGFQAMGVMREMRFTQDNGAATAAQ